MTSTINVADVERWASALGGAALTAYGIKQLKDRSPAGAALTAAGGALMFRGATGHCPMYAAAGINTADDREGTREALGGARGTAVEEVVTINATADRLFTFWRNLDQLPRFMDHLVSVHQVDERRSHWVAKAPGRRTVEWDAEIINEVPGELIGWRTLDGADVISAGSVRFNGCDRKPWNGGARSPSVRPACRQGWRDGRVAARARAVANDSRGPAPLQAADGNRRDRDHSRAAARQTIHSQLRLSDRW